MASNRPSRVVVSIPTASADGRFYGRYPHGDAPFVQIQAQPVAASAATGALKTSIKLRAAVAALSQLAGDATTGILLKGPAVAAAAAAAILTAKTRFKGTALEATTLSGVLTTKSGIAPRRYANGHMVAFGDPQTFNGNGSALGKDSGTFTLAVGDGSGTVHGNYSSASIPGGHLGSSQGYSRIWTAGQGNLQTGPFVVGSPSAGNPIITKACLTPYYWSELEPTRDSGDGTSYVWTRLDADIATCAALGVMLFVKLITKTFDGDGTLGTGTNPLPPYMSGATYPYTSNVGGNNPSSGYGTERWDTGLYKPRFLALAQAMGARYNIVPAFGGVGTQETSTGGGSPPGFSQSGYLTGLINEAIALGQSMPQARQIAFTNQGIAFSDIRNYWAAVVDNGGWCGGPDLVLIAGGLQSNVYPNYKLAQDGTSPIATKGRTLCSVQRAEWINIPPASATNTFLIGDLYKHGTGQVVPGAVTPDYFDLSGIIWDFHTANDGTSGQKYNPQCRDLQIANPTFGYGAPVK